MIQVGTKSVTDSHINGNYLRTGTPSLPYPGQGLPIEDRRQSAGIPRNFLQWHVSSSYNHIDLMRIKILRVIAEDFLLGWVVIGQSGRETYYQLTPCILRMFLLHRVYELRKPEDKLLLGIPRNDRSRVHSSLIVSELVWSKNEQCLLIVSQESIILHNF